MNFIFLNKILGIISLFLFIFGFFGNILTCLICLRPRLRKTSTFIYLFLISANDIFNLSVWNLDAFVYAFYGIFHENENEIWCKISAFLQYFCSQYSAWLLVFFPNKIVFDDLIFMNLMI